MNNAPHITPTSWLMIALLAFIWGGTFMAVSYTHLTLPTNREV